MMRLFWNPVVKPLLEATAAKRIIEIGAAEGNNSERLARWCRRHGAHLDIIDLAPNFDVAAFRAAFPGFIDIHIKRSLDCLADLMPADIILIDGDHNWYTVYNELRLIYGPSGPLTADAPVVVCHDVAWPYGRRDQYCDPDSIPAEYRRPMAQGGLAPHDSGLSPGGLNRHKHHALTQGGPRNGVRIGIVDALGDRQDQCRIVWLEVNAGLAIIAPPNRIASRSGLGPLLDRLEPSENWKVLAAMLEQKRIAGEIAMQELAGLQGSAPVVQAGERSFASCVPADVMAGIQHGMLAYRYKGRRMRLHPFDMANYLAVLGSLRPATIFEIGTFEGGRAMWLADTATALGIETRVIALDLLPPADLSYRDVSFYTGDARNLSRSFSDDMMAALPRPFLVIEDASHDEVTCIAALEFFDRHLGPGDMIVIEDGSLGPLLSKDSGSSAPSSAIARFLSARAEDYAIDAECCDRFGYNATANPNGWLRRK